MSPPKRTEAELEQRHALISGGGPRIAPLEVSELNDQALTLLAGLIEVNSAFEQRNPQGAEDLISAHAAGTAARGTAPVEADLPPLIRTMLRHPALFARQVEIGAELLGKGALPPRDRELVVLHVAWLSQAPFEWGEHVHIAKTAGLRAEEIERITEGASAPGWSAHDRALLRAVDELRADSMICDATWATLAQRYDERQLIELVIVIGQYQTIAYYQNSLRITLHDGNPGLKAR